MKTLLRALKSFWFLILALWAASLVVCGFVAPRVQWSREQLLETMLIVSTFYVLIIVLRQYKRIRIERNLENLVQIEVDRSLKSNGEFRDQQVLRDRLKHAIAMLRADRSAGGGGSSALYDLPWYLVIGMSAAGKTSLLTRSGLSLRHPADRKVDFRWYNPRDPQPDTDRGVGALIALVDHLAAE